MSDYMEIYRGDIVTAPRHLRLVNDWPDHEDTDQHYGRRIPAWAWLLCAGAGGFFGAVVYFAVGGAT